MGIVISGYHDDPQEVNILSANVCTFRLTKSSDFLGMAVLAPTPGDRMTEAETRRADHQRRA
jgi:hypothetical protein